MISNFEQQFRCCNPVRLYAHSCRNQHSAHVPPSLSKWIVIYMIKFLDWVSNFINCIFLLWNELAIYWCEVGVLGVCEVDLTYAHLQVWGSDEGRQRPQKWDEGWGFLCRGWLMIYRGDKYYKKLSGWLDAVSAAGAWARIGQVVNEGHFFRDRGGGGVTVQKNRNSEKIFAGAIKEFSESSKKKISRKNSFVFCWHHVPLRDVNLRAISKINFRAPSEEELQVGAAAARAELDETHYNTAAKERND